MAIDLRDHAGHNNTLTNNGATEVSASLPFGDSTIAIDLEKDSSQYLQASDSATLSITGDLTIEAWIKLESALTGFHQIVAKFETLNNHRSYYMAAVNNGGTTGLWFIASSDGSGATGVNVNWSPSTGVWYHVAVAYDASAGTADFYVNGSQQGTQQSGLPTSIYNGTAPLNIGCRYSGGSRIEFFDGQIDEVRIWNTLRTQTELNDNKAIELTGSETGLQAYYPFEDVGGAGAGVSHTTNAIIFGANF